MTKRTMDSVEVCCLKRMSKDATEHLMIPLKDGEKITIGRMSDATVSIPTSVMISRQHATLQQSSDGSWTITDNKSLNGVKINGRTITPAQPTVLQDNDIIQLGVAPAPDQLPEFVWRFRCRMRIKRFKYDNDDISAVIEQQSDKLSRCKTLNSDDFRAAFDNCNSKNVPHDPLLSRQSDLSLISPKTLSEHRTDCTTSCSDSSEQHCGSSCVESDVRLSTEMSRHARLEDEQREELRKQKEHLEEMTQLLKAKELEQQKVEEELREKALRLEEERQRQQVELELEQHKRMDELRVSYELKMVEQESSLMEKLNTDRQRLLDERLKVETSLQIEMTKKLEEKDRALEEQLLGEQRRLNEILEEKEEEKRRLEMELSGAKCESERVKAEDVSRARDDIMANLAGLMESELQCGICTEVFVKPTTLNCMHSFCAACIAQWMKIKKVCPACRAPIVTRLRSIVLDSYIDKMVEQLSADMKDKRQKLVNERNAAEASEAAEAKAKADDADAQVAAIIARNQQYLQAAATSGRGRRRSNATATIARLPAPPVVGAIRATRRAAAAATMRLPAPPVITAAIPVPVTGLPAPRSWVAQVQVMRAALHASNAALNSARLLAPPPRLECSTAPRLMAPQNVYLQSSAVSSAAALPIGSVIRLVAPPRAYPVGYMDARRTPIPVSTTSTVRPIVVTGAVRTGAPTPSTSAGTLASTPLVIVSEPPPVDNEVTVISEGEEEEEETSQSQNSHSSNNDSDSQQNSDDDSEEDEDESYFPSSRRRGGSNRPYYGGYGACYKCGSRGHWANGCPY